MDLAQQVSTPQHGESGNNEHSSPESPAQLLAKLRKKMVDYLELSGTTQTRFALEVGCPTSSLSAFLSGDRGMTFDEVVHSVRAMGFTMAELDASGNDTPIPILVYLKKLEYLYHSDKEIFSYLTGLIDTWLNVSENHEEA